MLVVNMNGPLESHVEAEKGPLSQKDWEAIVRDGYLISHSFVTLQDDAFKYALLTEPRASTFPDAETARRIKVGVAQYAHGMMRTHKHVHIVSKGEGMPLNHEWSPKVKQRFPNLTNVTLTYFAELLDALGDQWKDYRPINYMDCAVALDQKGAPGLLAFLIEEGKDEQDCFADMLRVLFPLIRDPHSQWRKYTEVKDALVAKPQSPEERAKEIDALATSTAALILKRENDKEEPLEHGSQSRRSLLAKKGGPRHPFGSYFIDVCLRKDSDGFFSWKSLSPSSQHLLAAAVEKARAALEATEPDGMQQSIRQEFEKVVIRYENGHTDEERRALRRIPVFGEHFHD